MIGGENKLSPGFVDGAPKLNPEFDSPGVKASLVLGDELPNPKPTGLPMLPPGFPKANAPGEALPKKLTGLSDEGRKILVEVVAVALPKRVVVALELSLPSKTDLLDSVVVLLPNTEPTNVDVGLSDTSEILNALVGLVVANTFGTLLEPRIGVAEVGRDDGPVDEPSVSWLGVP